MIPFLESAGGNRHDALTLVEEVAVTVKLPGARDGTVIEPSTNYSFYFQDVRDVFHVIRVIKQRLQLRHFIDS